MAYLSEFVTHLLATAVKESQRVHSILYSRPDDGHPMENDRRVTLITRQKLKGNKSNECHQDELDGARVQAG